MGENILCYGDSLTAGYYNYGMAFSPYGDILKAAGIGEVKVIGMSGWTTSMMLDNRSNEICVDCCGCEDVGLKIALDAVAYQHVILLAGTNDLGDDSNADEIFENLKQLIATCIETGVTNIALLTVPACSSEWKFPSLARERRNLNELIRNVQRNFDSRVYPIDITQLLPNGDENSLVRPEVAELWDIDGLHLSPAGSRTLGEYICAQVRLRVNSSFACGSESPIGSSTAHMISSEVAEGANHNNDEIDPAVNENRRKCAMM